MNLIEFSMQISSLACFFKFILIQIISETCLWNAILFFENFFPTFLQILKNLIKFEFQVQPNIFELILHLAYKIWKKTCWIHILHTFSRFQHGLNTDWTRIGHKFDWIWINLQFAKIDGNNQYSVWVKYRFFYRGGSPHRTPYWIIFILKYCTNQQKL